MNYVAGFLFNEEKTKVALVEKRKFPPGCDWSAAPLTAIGGKVDQAESPHQAIVREFYEETCLKIIK